MNLLTRKLKLILLVVLVILTLLLFYKFKGDQDKNLSSLSGNAENRFENLDKVDQKFLNDLGYTHISEAGFPYKYIRDFDGIKIEYGQYLEYRLLMKEGDSIVRRSTDMRPEMKTQLIKQPKNKLIGIDAIGDITADLSKGDIIKALSINLDSLKKLHSIDPNLNKITNWIVQIVSVQSQEELDKKLESLRLFKDSVSTNSKEFTNQLNTKLLDYYTAVKKQKNTFESHPIIKLPKTGSTMVHVTKNNGITIKKHDRVRCFTHLIKNSGVVEYSNYIDGKYEEFLFGISSINPVIEDALNLMSKGDEAYVVIPWLLAIDNFKYGQKPPEGTDLIMYIKLYDIIDDPEKYDLQ